MPTLSRRRSPLAIVSNPIYPVGRMGDNLRVLIVDDEKNSRSTLAVCLHALGCSTSEASSPEAALASLKREPFDVVFLDLRLGSTSGLDFLPKILEENPAAAVVMITAYATF